MINIIELKALENLNWDWTEQPCFRIPEGSYHRQVKVDPTPAYSNQLEVCKAEAKKSWKLFPIDRSVNVFSLDREEFGRTNGQTSYVQIYNEGEKPDWQPYILLFGKRIPPHPAMTRYLVSHEYGHVVHYYLQSKVGKFDGDEIYDEYKKLRKLKSPAYYGPGTWHASVSELFANDFRILVLGTEVEFWPHPGFQRPEKIAAVRDFWKRAQ